MTKIELHKIIIVITCFVAVLCGCTGDEVTNYHLPMNDVDNKFAQKLIERLRSQNDISCSFEKLLNGNIPVYDNVKVVSIPEYGLCYFVPYKNAIGHIDGAIFVPTTYKLQNDDCILLGWDLKEPFKVDGDILNNSIPTTSRYIYSCLFKDIGISACLVNSSLTAFSYYLDNHIMPLSDEELPEIETDTRLSTGGYVEIHLEYSSYYVGDKTDAVYGLGTTTLKDALEHYLWIYTGVQYNIEHRTLMSFYWRMDLSLFSENLMEMVLTEVCRTIRDKDFAISIQYSYRVIEVGGTGGAGVGTGTGGSGGGGGTGGPFTGGTGGSSTGSIDKSEIDPEQYDHPDTLEAGDSQIKIIDEVFKIYNLMKSAKANQIGDKKYISLNDFFNAVKNDRDIEHSSSLIVRPDGTVLMTDVWDGAAHSVDCNISDLDVTAVIHNHPNGSSPSATDLFSLFDTALKRDNYKAIFAYDDCTDVLYSIYLNTLDNKLINDFHKLISGDIDAETHWFIEDGAIYQMYYKRFLNYEDLSYINRHLYQLAYIAYENRRNFSIVKIEKEKFFLYDISAESIEKGKRNYKPVIYIKK